MRKSSRPREAWQRAEEAEERKKKLQEIIDCQDDEASLL
jgi:hypothetical protein